MTDDYNPRITKLTKQEWELLQEIEDAYDKGENINPRCFHAVDQPLVDQLCNIIRDLFDNLELLQK